MILRLGFLYCLIIVRFFDAKMPRESDMYSSVQDLSHLFLLEQRLVKFTVKTYIVNLTRILRKTLEQNEIIF